MKIDRERTAGGDPTEEKKLFRTADRREWRRWLSDHFETENEIWFIFPTKDSGEPSISYNDAVEEALCFGWIDGRAGTLDGARHIRRFTPRRKGSGYSRPNIERLIRMDGLGMIHPRVRDSVADLIGTPFVFPEDILEAIRGDVTAWENFLSFPEPYRRIRVAYVDAARKRPAEFEKRLGNLIKKSRENKMIAGYGGIDVYYPDCGETASAILVTAFEPFGGEKINPTETVLRRLPDRIGAIALKKALLPVEFVRAREIACAEYDSAKPCAVVMLGQAGGRAAITPETTGKNLMNARIPDNAGFTPHGVPVSEGGPETLRSTADIAGIADAVRSIGIPCEISDDAGVYVCNALLYGMLEHNGGAVPTVFIHVPYSSEQGHADKPFMEQDDIYRAVAAALGSVAMGIIESRAAAG